MNKKAQKRLLYGILIGVVIIGIMSLYFVSADVFKNNSNFNVSSVTFNMNSTHTLSYCGLSIDGATNVSMTLTASSTKANYTNSSIADGAHNFIISCNNTDNDWEYSGTYNFYIDTIFPLINFTSPTPATGSQSNTNIFVNLTSSDTTSNISTFIDFDNSLVGWWRMDDTNGSSNSVLDISGYGNNGTAQGDASQTNAGKLGKGFEFDGEGDYVDLGEPTSLDIDFSQITLSAWIRADGSVKDYGIVGKSTIWYLSFTSSDDVRLRHVNVGDGLTGIDIGDPIDTSWHHVVGTYNGTNTSIYFDGVYKGGGAATGTLGTSTSDVAIGDLRVGYGYYFNGSIDDVMIFNRSLSAEEIKGLYANTSNKYLNNNFTDLAVGNHTFKAYTQDYAGNINETEERTITITSDSCTYSSGNWIINCEDNCTITTNVNGDGSNFSANGVGFFSIQANISGFRLYHFGKGCNARCLGGNCIKI